MLNSQNTKTRKDIQLSWINEVFNAMLFDDGLKDDDRELLEKNEKFLEKLVERYDANLTINELNYEIDLADVKYILEKRFDDVFIIQDGKQVGKNFNPNMQALILIRDELEFFKEEYFIVYVYFGRFDYRLFSDFFDF